MFLKRMSKKNSWLKRIKLQFIIVMVVLLSLFSVVASSIIINALSIPSVVASSLTSASGSDMPFQKRSFYAENLFWAFYFSGYGGSEGIAYKTSSDGETWAERIVIRPSGGASNSWALWFDGINVSYSFTYGVSGGSVYYRKGIPQSDGTISWVDSEQTVYTCAEGHYPFYSTISTDSNDNPWIGFIDFDGSLTYIPTVTKSSTSNGTWTTDTDFPYVLDAVGGSTWAVTPVPQTDGKVYVLFGTGGHVLRGRPWTGSAFGDEENVGDTVLANCERYTAIADQDVIEVVMVESVTQNILHYERVSSWTYIATLETGNSHAFPAISYDAHDKYYCFWEGYPSEDHYCYSTYNGSSWGTIVDLINESSDGFEANNHPLVSYRSDDYYITITYLSGTDPNCDLKFYALNTEVIPINQGINLANIVIPLVMILIIIVMIMRWVANIQNSSDTLAMSSDNQSSIGKVVVVAVIIIVVVGFIQVVQGVLNLLH